MAEIIEHLSELHLEVQDPVLIFALVMLIILVAPLLFTRLRLPGIVGLIVSGIIVGPHGLGLFAREGIFELLGTVGLIYLMFLAGLEINLNQFSRQRNHSLTFGATTFLLPQILGAVFAFYLFGFSWPAAILLASMFASHTLIPYSIVIRLGIAKNRAVTTAIGGTILTDTAALMVLSVVAEASVRELNALFWIRQAISIALLIFIALYILPRIAYWFFRNIDPDGPSEFIFVMAAVFLSAFGAEIAGIEPIIGAFLAGLALSSLIPEQSPLMRRLEFTGNALFIPFFLLSVGMLVDLRVLVAGSEAWAIAIYMVVMVMITKWIGAWIAQKILGYSSDEGWILFGLSVNQAAATLAAVLVGYRIELFDETVLNGTIMMILVTCIVGPWVTERFGRRIVLSSEDKQEGPLRTTDRILIPLSNDRTADALMDLAFMLRPKETKEPVLPINVALDGPEVDSNVASGEKLLGNAVVRATAAEVPVQPVTRIETNVAGGILRTLRELRVSTIIMGWAGESSARHIVFHTIQDRVLEQTRQMIVIARLGDPLNTTKRVVLAMPPLIERQSGFNTAIGSLKILTNQIGAKLHIVALDESINRVRNSIESMRPHIPVEFQPIHAWHGLLPGLRSFLETGDLVILLSVRRGRLAWQPALERMPSAIAREYPKLGLLVVFPPEFETEPIERPKPSADAEALLPGLTEARARFDLDGVDISEALHELLSPSFSVQPGLLDSLVTRLSDADPVELTPGAMLLHAHVAVVEDSVVFLGVNHKGFLHPSLTRPAPLLFVLLSAKQQSPEKHLNTLAQIAQLVREPAMVDRMSTATNFDELVAASKEPAAES